MEKNDTKCSWEYLSEKEKHDLFFKKGAPFEDYGARMRNAFAEGVKHADTRRSNRKSKPNESSDEQAIRSNKSIKA